MKYAVSMGGGMGDIFHNIMKSSAYANLMNLKPEDTCDVLLICHNPFITELFKWHPKRDQLNVKWFGYWSPENDRAKREEFGAHLQDILPPGPDALIKFYPSPDDCEIIERLSPHKTILISAGAGIQDRNIPDSTMEAIIGDLVKTEYSIVGVGRTYEREGGHREYEYPMISPQVVSLVDKLSIPGVIHLTSMCRGVISCHSAVCLMAWWFRKPNMLVVPKNVSHANGINRGENNDWTFGLFQLEGQLVYAEEYTAESLATFLGKL